MNFSDSSDGDAYFDHDEHWFVDAEDDEEFEEMMKQKNLREYGYTVRTKTKHLTCPGCFVTLCIDFQSHTYYPDQFRTIFVQNCSYNEKETRVVEDDLSHEKKTYYKVRCDECYTEVGAFDPEDEVYHLFDVLYGS